jgi:FkbM family methyltransferase
MMIITPANLFPLLKSYLPDNPTIIEAGAFNGNDSKKLSQFFPSGIVHAFEPVPEIFEELILQTQNSTNIYRYQIALSTQRGNMPFYLAEHPKKPGKICQAGTLLEPKERLTKSPIIYPKIITVPTTTLDDWAKQYSIATVDFIWLDLQGHELAVLQASPEILKKVRLIYLEVNFIQAYENQPTPQEIESWMKKHNFEPVAQDFDDNHQWFFGNVLYARNR